MSFQLLSCTLVLQWTRRLVTQGPQSQEELYSSHLASNLHDPRLVMHVSRCLFVDGKLFIKGPCFIATYYLRPVCLSEMDIRNSQAQEPRMPELVLPIRSKAEHTAVGSV